MGLNFLNQCTEEERVRRCVDLVPPRVWQHLLAVDARKFAGDPDTSSLLRITMSEDGAQLHLRVPAERYQGDYCLSLDLEDAGGGQLELAFIVVNDLTAPRFNIDVDERGRSTLLGTATRNRGEELRAMAAGLGPCQVRRGLRLFGELMPRLEAFGGSLGYVGTQLRPLTYRSAILYERCGFQYVLGRQRMKRIDKAFQPGGTLVRLLDSSSPFRMPHLAQSVRGRSWAIHDGILQCFDGNEQLDLLMSKAFGTHSRDMTCTLGN